MDCYIYQADLYCETCAIKIKTELLAEGKAPANPHDEYTYDSDDYPKGPYDADVSDTPDHCGQCYMFLENPLTPEGLEYVREAIGMILSPAPTTEGRYDTVKEWYQFYFVDNDGKLFP